jgi:redox-sensitive bicupin YhaK (pirin superfamily)
MICEWRCFDSPGAAAPTRRISMSYHKATAPVCSQPQGAIDLLIRPRRHDLGGFTVRRVLPASKRPSIGPFVFFDEMGPAVFPPGEGISVRPHPHIGLATLTYLFEGEILHRDSLGFVQPIRPGAVNLMTAGRGIVHSERPGEDLHRAAPLHGIQSWMALPIDQEEREPSFEHYPAEAMPAIEQHGARVRVIVGNAFGQTSPVHVCTPTLYLDCSLESGRSLTVPRNQADLGAYVVAGRVRIDDTPLKPGTMAVLCAGTPLALHAEEDSRVVVIGGEPLGRRHLWWNFVASSKARIEQAKADWKEGRFGRIAGETEFIPLPD